MPVIVTNQEGEATAVSRVLSGSATVDRRGHILLQNLEKIPFDLREDKPRICMGITFQKDNTTNPGSSAVAWRGWGVLEIRDSNDGIIARINTQGNNSTSAAYLIILETYDDSGVWQSPHSVIVGPSNFDSVGERFDLDVEYDEGTDEITVKAYYSGIRAAQSTFDATIPGVGMPRRGLFGAPDHNSGTTANRVFRVWDMVLAEDSTVGLELTTLQGSAVGEHEDAEGSYVSISGSGVNMTTGIIFDTVGQKESWIVTPLDGKSYTGSAIGGIALTIIAGASPGSDVQEFRPFVRVGSTDYPHAETFTVSDEMRSYTVVFEENPATSSAWTGSQVTNGVEVGIEAM